jgi:hypothetical protein
MIEVKRVEIRDAMTTMPALALRVRGGSEDPVLWRAGFGELPEVILVDLVNWRCQYDPFSWSTPARTLPAAHRWLRDNWDEHRDGGVVDVQYILGERATPKEPEIGRSP